MVCGAGALSNDTWENPWQGTVTQCAAGICAVIAELLIIPSNSPVNIVFSSLHVMKSCIFRIWISTWTCNGQYPRVPQQDGLAHLTSFWRVGGEVHFELHLSYNESPGSNHNVKNIYCHSWAFSVKEVTWRNPFLVLVWKHPVFLSSSGKKHWLKGLADVNKSLWFMQQRQQFTHELSWKLLWWQKRSKITVPATCWMWWAGLK